MSHPLQAHPTGYRLIYRPGMAGLGSLKRRLRNCLVGARADAWPSMPSRMSTARTTYLLMERARGQRVPKTRGRFVVPDSPAHLDRMPA